MRVAEKMFSEDIQFLRFMIFLTSQLKFLVVLLIGVSNIWPVGHIQSRKEYHLTCGAFHRQDHPPSWARLTQALC